MRVELLTLTLRTGLYFVLLTLVFAPLELALPRREDRRTRRALRTDVLFGTIGALLTRLGILALSATLLSLVAEHGDAPLRHLPSFVSIPLGLLLFELGSYAYHRAAHAVPCLWRLHAVHHSSTSFDFLAGFRQHPLEIVLMTMVQNLPLVALGLPLGEHALIVVLLQINTLFVHANVAIPPRLERALGMLIATPRFHAQHHARDARGANLATLFPFFDRLFGTFSDATPGEEADAFGLRPEDELDASFVGLLSLRRLPHESREAEEARPWLKKLRRSVPG